MKGDTGGNFFSRRLFLVFVYNAQENATERKNRDQKMLNTEVSRSFPSKILVHRWVAEATPTYVHFLFNQNIFRTVVLDLKELKARDIRGKTLGISFTRNFSNVMSKYLNFIHPR